MKKSWLLVGASAIAGMLLGAGFALEPVKAEAEAASGIRVYVLNVNKVFQDYEKFKRLRDGLKGDIEATENQLRASENIIKGKIESLNSLTNAADRDKVEKEVADLKFQFEKDRRKYQAEFLTKEAAIYSTVYKEMTDLVGEYCGKYGIHLVLRLKAEADESNPQAVLQTLSREVVFHHPNLDLTEAMSTALNQRQTAAATGQK